jgi:hypothetical protein
MKTMKCVRFWATLALCTTTWLTVPCAQAGKLYKWVDENGQTRYGDRIPPQYAKKRNETLNNQGIVVETKAAAKTPEQLAEEKRLAVLKAEQERERQEQAREDRILLDTFTNEDEMILTRDGKIEAIEAVIRITEGRIHKTKQRLSALNGRAADLERAGKPVPDQLKADMAEARGQIQHNLDYIENRKREQQKIREKFARDIQRFRELKSDGEKTNAARR